MVAQFLHCSDFQIVLKDISWKTKGLVRHQAQQDYVAQRLQWL
jgi:hypothetical protein